MEFVPGRRYLVLDEASGCYVGTFDGLNKVGDLLFSDRLMIDPGREDGVISVAPESVIDAEPWLQLIEPADTAFTDIRNFVVDEIKKQGRVEVKVHR